MKQNVCILKSQLGKFKNYIYVHIYLINLYIHVEIELVFEFNWQGFISQLILNELN